MKRLPGARKLLRLPRSQTRVAREVGEEIAFHLEERTAALIEEGLTPAEARAEAIGEFGDLSAASAEIEKIDRRRVRRLSTSNWWADLGQDVRYGARTLARSPGFTLAAVLMLALGSGANTAIFSILHAALLRPLPFVEPDRLMTVTLTMPSVLGSPPRDDQAWSFPKFEIFRTEQRIFSNLAVHFARTVTLEHQSDPPERLSSEVVGASYFRTLGVAPFLGRDFLPEEDTAPGVQTAIVSHGLWSRSLNADPAVIGEIVNVAGTSFEVVGVMPQGFHGLSGAAEIWLPVMSPGPFGLEQAFTHNFSVVARLGPGVDLQQAQVAVEALGKRVDRAFPYRFGDGAPWGAMTRPLNDERVDPMLRRAVLLVFSAASLVLLIACANVASLLLARGTARRREVAVRLAIGASRARLVRQLLTESLLLAAVGGLVGMLLAWTSLYLVLPTESGWMSAVRAVGDEEASALSLLVLSSIRIDGTVLLFTGVSVTLAAAIFGVVPAWRASRVELSKTIRSGEDAVRASGHGRVNGRGLLVSCEIAVALVVLITTGLTLRSLGNLLASPVGFDPEGVLTLQFSLPPDEYQAQNASPVLDQMLEAVRGISGVEAASIGNCPPLDGDCNTTAIVFTDRPPVDRDLEETIGQHYITPDYLETLQVPLLEGRALKPTDRGDTPHVLLINETAARKFWPNESPIGKIIGMGAGDFPNESPIGKIIGMGAGDFGEGEIVGIVGDLRYETIDEPSRPDVFVSYLQAPRLAGFLYVRTAIDPTALTGPVLSALREVEPRVTLWDVKSMEQRVGDAVWRPRFLASLLSVFAGIALALSAIGIYGVISFEVSQRRREVGIRMALGAARGKVLRLVLSRGVMLAGSGIALGLIGGWAAGGVMGAVLYGVSPTDPLTFAAVAIGIAAVALGATLIPALRATRVDPAVAIREG